MSNSEVERSMKLIFDTGKCTGCKICELACSAKHEGVFNPRKARLKIIDRYIETGRETKLKSCTLCMECVETCPTEAIISNGKWLTLDEELCTSCGICVDACPEGLIYMKSDDLPAIPDFCQGNPYCIEWCPQKCLILEVE